MSARRDVDGRLQRISRRRHDVALIVERKGSIAGVGDGAVRHGDLQEAAAVHRHVQVAVGLQHAALGVIFFRRDDAHARAQGQAGRILGILRALRADLPDVLVHQILKGGPPRLEACRVGIGQIVGDHRHPRVLRVETGFCGP